jgi:hypothetical protein
MELPTKWKRGGKYICIIKIDLFYLLFINNTCSSSDTAPGEQINNELVSIWKKTFVA